MNVHRWRHLEGADPAAHELLLQTQALLRRLITMTEVGDASLKFTWRLCLAVPDSKMYRAAAAGAGAAAPPLRHDGGASCPQLALHGSAHARLCSISSCISKWSCVPWVTTNLRMQRCRAATFRAARSC